MSYAMRLHFAPRRRNEGEPAIGVAQAEQLAQQLEQQRQVLSSKAAAYLQAASDIRDKVKAHAEDAAAQVKNLMDQLTIENEAYARLYEQVESAWYEWEEPSSTFETAYNNSPSDFDNEISDIDDVLTELLA